MKTRGLLLGALLLCTGCQRAQSYSILGSYFPAWLFCIAAGIAAATLIYFLLQRRNLSEQLALPLFIYPMLAIGLTLGIWLVLYS